MNSVVEKVPTKDYRKKVLIGLVAIIVLACLAVFALANIVGISVNSPTNASEIYTTLVNLTITTNVTAENCTAYLSTTSTANNTGMDLLAEGPLNTQWRYNMTLGVPNTGYRSVWFRCGNGSYYDSNLTLGLTYFTINEVAVNGVVATGSNLTNGTTYDEFPVMNLTLNRSAAYCEALLNYGNGTLKTASLTAMTGRTRHYLTTNPGDTNSTNFASVTWFCNDTWGNKTWINTSATNLTYVKWDSTPPKITNDNTTWINISNSRYLNISWMNTEEYQLKNCSVRVYSVDDSAYIDKNATVFGETTDKVRRCNITLTGDDVRGTGYFKIEKIAYDTLGHKSAGATNYANQTGVTYALKSGTWNLIGAYGLNGALKYGSANETFLHYCQNITGATYISWFNQSELAVDTPGGNHSYVTYQCGSAGYAKLWTISDGSGIYVSVSADTQYAIVNYTDFVVPKRQLTANASTSDTAWNQLGIWNTSWPAGKRLSEVCALDTNITYASYHDFSNNTYYTHKCTGKAWDINNVSVPIGSAVWIQLNTSVSKNTGDWLAG